MTWPAIVVGAVLAVAGCSGGGSGRTASGERLWEFEGLLRSTFGHAGVAAEGDDFDCAGDCSPTSDFALYEYVFDNHRDSDFHISQRGLGDFDFGQVDPVLITIS